MTPDEATALLEPHGTGFLNDARAEYRATLGAAIDDARAKMLQAEELLVAVQGAIARLSAHITSLETEAARIDLALSDGIITSNGHRPQPTEGGTYTGPEGELPPEHFDCQLCHRGNFTAPGLKIHMGRMHPTSPPVAAAQTIVDQADQFGPNGEIAPPDRGYHCTDCNFGYGHLADLKDHVRKLHDRGLTPAEREERKVPRDQWFFQLDGETPLPWRRPD